MPDIQRVIGKAREQRNSILFVQALTTLGEEYRLLGEIGKARKAYRDAPAALGSHEITLLAAPVQKGLEMLG